MNYLDFIFAGIAVAAFILGFKDGFVRKLIGSLGFFLAIFLGIMLSDSLGSILNKMFGMEKYLADLKKTEKQIFDDFAEQATKRVKAGLVSRQIALNKNLQAEPTEIDQEIELVKKAYPNDKTVEENVKRPEVRETIAVAVQNRKVMRWLKNKIMTNS